MMKSKSYQPKMKQSNTSELSSISFPQNYHKYLFLIIAFVPYFWPRSPPNYIGIGVGSYHPRCTPWSRRLDADTCNCDWPPWVRTHVGTHPHSPKTVSNRAQNTVKQLAVFYVFLSVLMYLLWFLWVLIIPEWPI